jgi:hypothetical protein
MLEEVFTQEKSIYLWLQLAMVHTGTDAVVGVITGLFAQKSLPFKYC